MKRNAQFRILLWGTVLLALLALFLFLLYNPVGNRRMETEPIAETMVAVPLTRVPDADAGSANAVAVSSANVRSTPDSSGEIVAFAERGTKLQILRQEQIGGKKWGYVGAPTLGWIDMYYVELLEPVTAETVAAATEPPELPDNGQYNAVVTADAVNVRTMPSSEAPIAGMVKKGDALLITRQEIVNDFPWGYTTAPVYGWILMQYVELPEPIAEDKTIIDTPVQKEEEVQGNGVSLDAASIRDMEIEWAAGSIVIQPMDIQQIYIREETAAEDYDQMVWNVRNGKVSIQYAQNTDHAFGMGLLKGDPGKDLIIQVPIGWQCDSLEIDAAAASLEINDLTIREMEFDGASGTCVFNNCTVETLDVDTASGDVLFKGALTRMDCDAASANIQLELNNVPTALELDSASGDLDVVLPEDAGFTVTMDTMSGNFESDFETTVRNGSHVAGNGRCRIEVDAMSSDVTVRKGA